MKNKRVLPNKEFFKEMISLLEEGKTVSLKVKGTSMKPFLDEDTEAFISKETKFLKGDICLFMYNDQYLLHRLLKIEKDTYYFRGDNSIRIEKVLIKNIYGKVLYYKRNNITIKPNTFLSKFKWYNFLLFRKLKSLAKHILRRS